MDICERLDAALDCFFETIGRVGLRKLHSCLNSRQHVFGTVLRLARQNRNLRLTALALGYVAGDLRCTNDLTLRISNRRDSQRNIYQTPMLSLTNGFIRLDPLTASDALKDRILFLLIFQRDQNPDGLTD